MRDINIIVLAMEELLRSFVKANIKTLFKYFEVVGEEQIIKYDKKGLGRIDLLLENRSNNKFIIIEVNYKNTNEESITQLNKYFTYFIKNHRLNPNNVRRVLVDVNISKDIRELCKHSNIECKIVSSKVFENWKRETTQDRISIDEKIINILTPSENPISTRKLSLKVGANWNTVIRHCLKLQLAGKIEEIKLSNINFWRIKK